MASLSHSRQCLWSRTHEDCRAIVCLQHANNDPRFATFLCSRFGLGASCIVMTMQFPGYFHPRWDNVKLYAGASFGLQVIPVKLTTGDFLYPLQGDQIMNGLIKVRANIQEPKVTGWVGVCQIWKSVEEHGHIYFAGMTESEYQNRSWCAMLSDFSITMSCGIERKMSRADAIVEEAIGKPFKREHHNRSVREDDWKHTIMLLLTLVC